MRIYYMIELNKEFNQKLKFVVHFKYEFIVKFKTFENFPFKNSFLLKNNQHMQLIFVLSKLYVKMSNYIYMYLVSFSF